MPCHIKSNDETDDETGTHGHTQERGSLIPGRHGLIIAFAYHYNRSFMFNDSTLSPRTPETVPHTSMDKADFGWTSISKDSDGESDLEADPQNDATKDDAAKAGTSPTFLGWTHGCVLGIW